MAVAAAVPLGGSAPSKDAAAPVPAAARTTTFTDSGGQGSSSSYALPLLALGALALILGFAGVHLRRYRRRMQLEARWREQDAAWEAALRRAELRKAPPIVEPPAQPLRRVNVG